MQKYIDSYYKKDDLSTGPLTKGGFGLTQEKASISFSHTTLSGDVYSVRYWHDANDQSIIRYAYDKVYDKQKAEQEAFEKAILEGLAEAFRTLFPLFPIPIPIPIP